MGNSPIVHARVGLELRIAADRVFAQLGITPTEAIRRLYASVVASGALPSGLVAENEPATSAGPSEAIVGVAIAVAEPPPVVLPQIEQPMNAQWDIPASPMPSQSLRR